MKMRKNVVHPTSPSGYRGSFAVVILKWAGVFCKQFMMMNADENIFRIMLIIGFVAFMLIGVYHRMKAKTDEKLDRRQEGLFILLPLRITGMIGMGGLIAYMINPAWMAWSSLPLPGWIRWAGIGMGFIAGLFLYWTFRDLGKNLTDTVVTRHDHTLVTTGPYYCVRHPFYTSAELSFLANSLAAANWFLFSASILFFILISIRTGKEEQNLIARFGDDYRNYMKTTGRFFPKIG